MFESEPEAVSYGGVVDETAPKRVEGKLLARYAQFEKLRTCARRFVLVKAAREFLSMEKEIKEKKEEWKKG